MNLSSIFKILFIMLIILEFSCAKIYTIEHSIPDPGLNRVTKVIYKNIANIGVFTLSIMIFIFVPVLLLKDLGDYIQPYFDKVWNNS